eukprot:SAG31_NODE_22876_length_516_cov_0.853717_2_plen_96_part_01
MAALSADMDADAFALVLQSGCGISALLCEVSLAETLRISSQTSQGELAEALRTILLQVPHGGWPDLAVIAKFPAASQRSEAHAIFKQIDRNGDGAL